MKKQNLKRKTSYRCKHNKKQNRKFRLWVWIFIITISAGMMIVSVWKILDWKRDNQNTNKQYVKGV